MENGNRMPVGYDVYRDIQARTGGEIYIGVCGPVRCGKSTFIKRFMELLVLPGIENTVDKERARDEMPQSAAGKTIMTTEPKFIPKEAVRISISDDVSVDIRLIDCVGYMVDGATGHEENGEERLVKTPWFDYEIPFTKAAEIGTRKVINEHSTIGVVMTTDGSIGELPREAYIPGEVRTIEELKNLGKPFVVILNTVKPHSAQTKELVQSMEEEYGELVLPLNCDQMRSEDIQYMMGEILSAFPVTEMDFYLPKWVEMLEDDHPVKSQVLREVRQILMEIDQVRDVEKNRMETDCEYIKEIRVTGIHMENGSVSVEIAFDETYYYQVISEMVGVPIAGEYQLIGLLKELSAKKNEIDNMGEAWNEVRHTGYGVVVPSMEDIEIAQPEIIKHGNKYGVKIKAVSPSVHLIRANIETEIAPIVGSEEQARDLITYISDNAAENPDGIWNTNIFGKTIRQLVDEGIGNKIHKLTDESQMKLQETIQKVINDSNGGLVCIII